MFEEMKKLMAGRIHEVDPRLAHPLLRWASGPVANIHAMAEVNRRFFWMSPEMALSAIYAAARVRRIGKFPKSERKKDDGDAAARELIMTYFGWSEQELSRSNPDLVMDRVDLDAIAEELGYERKAKKQKRR